MPESAEKPPIVLVDASNVAYGGGLLKGPRMHLLARVLEELRKHPFRVGVVADASLRHVIDEPERLEEMIQSGLVTQAPAGREADDFLIQLALKRQEQGETVYILTNDLFPVKSAKGVVPRITFVHFSFHDIDELVFSPPLETIQTHSKEDGGAEAALAQGLPEAGRDLLEAFFSFVASLEPAVNEGSRIPFSRVAGYLHNQFDGDFCRRFGLRRPKELARSLETEGYVKLHGTTPLYLEATRKLVEEVSALKGEAQTPPAVEPKAPAPQQVPERAPDIREDGTALEAALEALKRENHYPTEERIGAKLRELFPGRGLQAKSIIERALGAGALVKEEVGTLTCYWPASGRWEAINPDDPSDPYPEEAWRAFRESLRRLPPFRRSSQTRYHLALHLGKFGEPMIADLPQAFREHMVQLAVRKKILIPSPTMMGMRIDVPREV
ncbi:MAG: hypothetical protein QW379_08700 [Thermoplasmata archaeon]